MVFLIHTELRCTVNHTSDLHLIRIYKVSSSAPTPIATTHTMGRSHPPLELEKHPHAPNGIRVSDHCARVQTTWRCQGRLALHQMNSATRTVYFSVLISLLLFRLIGRDSSPTPIHCCLYTRDCNLTQYAISPTFNHVPLNPSSDISVINEIFPLFTYPACFYLTPGQCMKLRNWYRYVIVLINFTHIMTTLWQNAL